MLKSSATGLLGKDVRSFDGGPWSNFGWCGESPIERSAFVLGVGQVRELARASQHLQSIIMQFLFG